MGNSKFFKSRVLTSAEQLYMMSVRWPNFSACRSGKVLMWRGEVKPSPISATYTVQVRYEPTKRPKVEVATPELKSLPGKRIPHTFPDGTLCLHLHHEWNGAKFIAHTILHWAAFWLYFYEVWLLTGDWEGGGHEPPQAGKGDE
jgi:hypothetical protein